MTIKIDIERVDAEVAHQFLLCEKPPEKGVKGTNRKSSKQQVADYAAAMLRGEWNTTHQGVAFDEDGNFVDGGQRMRALILAAETDPDIFIMIPVAYGVPSSATNAMDIGKKRLPADFLTMQGESNATTLGAVIRLVYCYDNVPWVGLDSWKKFRMTPAMRQNFLDENPKLRSGLPVGSSVKKVLKPSASAAFHFLAQRKYPLGGPVIDKFLELLRTGLTGVQKGNPAHTLREYMFNLKERNMCLDAGEELALIIKAFNRWNAGGQYDVIFFRKGESYPRL